ncbi:MAG: DNA metabolism protein [Ruminococcaceae bacterium]|nr:DNA metabolism protein [Oscillospiraceae bacterium]
MPGKSDVMPCGRRTYCGRANCRHTAHCRKLEAQQEQAAAKSGADVHGPAQGRAPRPRPAPSPKKPLARPADVVYLYDGSLPGFYCCVYESVYSHELPLAIWPEDDAPPTLFRQKLIATEQDKAERVRASVPKKISAAALELVETVYLSCLAEKEIAMLRFLLLGYQRGRPVMQMLGHADVAPMLAAQKHLGGEAHLLLGFVRFSDYDGVLGATISPKNFILPFIASHFVSRYAQEDFLIYDKTHKAALIYEQGRQRIVPMEGIVFPKASEAEEAYRAMWKQFYNTISIEARENPRCRMTHMPKRYWENMLEVQDLL